jgi:hypothetical protein
MAKKWADYLISGAWFTSNGGSKKITHVLLHKDSETGFETGVKTSETEVIRLIKAGKTAKTIVWNYSKGTFNVGADVGYETVRGKEWLRTHKDGTVIDNLDYMLNMGWLI